MEDAKAPAAAQAQSHPLEDVSLNGNDDDKQTPKNWVKFDDEADSGEKNNNSNDGDAHTAAAAATTTKQVNSAAHRPSVVSCNNNRRARSRSPVATVTTTTTTPVQRPAVSSTTAATPGEVQPPAPPPDVAPAVLTTESTHVNLSASGSGIVSGASANASASGYAPGPVRHTPQLLNQKAAAAPSPSSAGAASSGHQHNGGGANGTGISQPADQGSGMRTIELSTGRIREGFANGDVIVTLLPANTKWPWITPAIFRPELVPEELMAQGLTLTVEDYVNAMETLVNDYRFTVYNICYKRILVCWILFAFTVLLALLFSGLQGVALFALGVGWLFLNAAAIFLCMWVKLRLSRGLEKCLARVNRQLMRHKILLVLDDRGRISCHKVNLCFMYFDATQCVNFLNEFLEHTEQTGGDAIKAGWEAKLDIDLNDIVIQGSQPVRMPRKQERGLQLFLRYGSRWGMEALRGLVDVTPLEPGRHCGQFQCPCQYIKEHLQCKPRGKFKCCNLVHWVMASERYDIDS
ncbi:GM10680 [Drosophila sechellia]|uniref:GM10680 n=1 Tax=Drosophila sechellia TaxID=7238 RepID=B4IEP7_DROSE|nr:GM10680 [Drosophila sechellia]